MTQNHNKDMPRRRYRRRKNADQTAANFSMMSRDELLSYCRALYAEKGIEAFNYSALKTIPKLYHNLYRKSLGQKALLEALGLQAEYNDYLKTTTIRYGAGTRERWSWDRIVSEVRSIVSSHGYLPPALWFQKNGRGALIQAIYYHGHSWEDIREAVGDFSGSNFVQSRNGKRWLSHAEASLSNFLYARGIEHKKGERYDANYAESSPARYALYDLHFLGADGNWYDVEIWGDRPHGHNEERYAKIRAAKEAFNADNNRFLGIHHADCYDEAMLTNILKPMIGVIEPFRFDKATDQLIYSTHWSNADELLATCAALAAQMPDRMFPTEEWLRKRGKWSDRDGPVYNTLSIYIKLWLGGVRKLRKLLGQEAGNTIQWDRSSALEAFKAFWEKYGVTPNQVRHEFHRQATKVFSKEQADEATRIATAVDKYAGGALEAAAALGIEIERKIKWERAILISELRRLTEQYGLTPNQIIYDYKRGRLNLSPAEVQLIGQVKDALGRFPGGPPAALLEIGFRTPTRKRHRNK